MNIYLLRDRRAFEETVQQQHVTPSQAREETHLVRRETFLRLICHLVRKVRDQRHFCTFTHISFHRDFWSQLNSGQSFGLTEERVHDKSPTGVLAKLDFEAATIGCLKNSVNLFVYLTKAYFGLSIPLLVVSLQSTSCVQKDEDIIEDARYNFTVSWNLVCKITLCFSIFKEDSLDRSRGGFMHKAEFCSKLWKSWNSFHSGKRVKQMTNVSWTWNCRMLMQFYEYREISQGFQSTRHSPGKGGKEGST